MLFYKGICDIKQDIMGALKLAFSLDKDFPYDLVNQDTSTLKIFNAYPRETRQFPCVIVSNATIKPKIYGIGDEFREYNEFGIRESRTETKNYGSAFEYTIDIECATESTTERDQLTDRTTIYLWWVCRRYLEMGGLIVTEVGSSGEDASKEIANDKVFVGRLTLKCWTEWTEVVSHDVIESLNIRFQEIMDIRRLGHLGTEEAIQEWVKKMTREGQMEG